MSNRGTSASAPNLGATGGNLHRARDARHHFVEVWEASDGWVPDVRWFEDGEAVRGLTLNGYETPEYLGSSASQPRRSYDLTETVSRRRLLNNLRLGHLHPMRR